MGGLGSELEPWDTVLDIFSQACGEALGQGWQLSARSCRDDYGDVPGEEWADQEVSSNRGKQFWTFSLRHEGRLSGRAGS